MSHLTCLTVYWQTADSGGCHQVSHASSNKQHATHNHLQVIAHSMGAWAAYEFLTHARANGMPLPVKAFLSAMPQPDIPLEQRPWKQQASLDEAQFQVRLLSTKVLCQR